MANDSQFRVQDDRFGGEPAATAPPRQRSTLATCLTGCLIIFIVILVLGVLAGIWIYRKLPEWSADFASQAAKQVIEETDLPADEKTDIALQIDRLADAARARKLSLVQLSTFAQDFVKSPLMTTIAMSMIDKKYISTSGLTDEEKAEARITVQRFMRGAVDEKISEAAVKKAMTPVSDVKPDGNMELKDEVTDEELKQFLTIAKEEADAAQIPEHVEAVDPSDEFTRLVDKTLAEGNAAAAADEPPANEPAADEEGAPAEIEAPAEQN